MENDILALKVCDLIIALRKNGFEIKKFILLDNGYSYRISGNYIKGFIYDLKIIADNKRCFDKPSKCPLQLELPRNQQEIDYVINRLLFWGTKKGFKLTNRYEHDTWNLNYPKDLGIEHL